jgi:hypothetical protein
MIILTANYNTSKIVNEWVEDELYENGWHKPFPISIRNIKGWRKNQSVQVLKERLVNENIKKW